MKKKQEEPKQGSPEWMATFSDLMNLLLCFFVLLFSMSSVDQSKAVAMIKSLNDTFSIFSGGGASFENGVLISSGATQLSNLDEYFQEAGRTDEGASIDNVDNTTPGGEDTGTETQNENPGPQGEGGKDNDDTSEDNLDKAYDKLLEEKQDSTGLVYDEIMGLADKFSILDILDVSVDKKTYDYVSLEINGAVLFESGSADIKPDAKPILARVSDILKQYRGYKIEVIGHTDNLPTNPEYFKDNDILSACRAISVASFFAEDRNMGWSDIYYAGRGEHEPVATNATEEGRAMNRRVEIRLYTIKNK